MHHISAKQRHARELEEQAPEVELQSFQRSSFYLGAGWQPARSPVQTLQTQGPQGTMPGDMSCYVN